MPNDELSQESDDADDDENPKTITNNRGVMNVNNARSSRRQISPTQNNDEGASQFGFYKQLREKMANTFDETMTIKSTTNRL